MDSGACLSWRGFGLKLDAFFLGFGFDILPSGYHLVRKWFFRFPFSRIYCFRQPALEPAAGFVVDGFRADSLFHACSFYSFRLGFYLAAFRFVPGCDGQEPGSGFRVLAAPVRYHPVDAVVGANVRYRDKAKVVAGAFFLAMLRSRGIIVCAALGLFALLHAVCRKGMNWRLAGSLIGREMLLFLPALAVSVFLFAVQMRNQEVVFGMGKDSLWRIADMGRIMGNLVSFPLFLLDLGKVFLWVALLFVVLKYGWAKVWASLPCPLVGAYAVLLVVFFLMTVPFKNPYGGRYFMLLYILMSLLLGKLMFDLMPLRRARLLCVGLMLLLGTAHLGWYSTLRVTQWDCFLAHLPYYSLRRQALDYLQDRQVAPHQVCSFFPADKSSNLIDLDKAMDGVWADESFAPEASGAEYVLYSNLSNVLDRSRAGIDSSFVLQKRFEKGLVYIEVWKRP